jgi:hypothetical protein
VADYTDHGPPIWVTGRIIRLDSKGGSVQLANSLTELSFNDSAAADLAQLKVGARVSFTIGAKSTYGEVSQLKVTRLRVVE